MLYANFQNDTQTLSQIADKIMDAYSLEYLGIFCLIYCRGSINRDRLKEVYMCNDRDIDNMILAGFVKEKN